MYKFWIIGLVLAMLEDLCCSVKIQKITVPSVVVMDYNPNNVGRPNLSAPDFLLDCDYDVGENETKIVVKWFLNQQLIYQWIPPRYPTELSHMKNRIKKNFTVSNDPLKMFRALSVTRPSLNLTGEYTCSVQTFESSDKKSSFLQIIVPESHFKLNFHTTYDYMVQIKCSAFNVYPEPKLTLNINNAELSSDVSHVKLVKDSRDGLYDVKAVARLPRNTLKPDTIINCQLSIPKTDYKKNQKTVYFEQVPTLSDPDSDEEADLVLSLESETGLLTNHHTKDHSTSSSKPYTIIFFECYMILFFTIFVTKLC